MIQVHITIAALFLFSCATAAIAEVPATLAAPNGIYSVKTEFLGDRRDRIEIQEKHPADASHAFIVYDNTPSSPMMYEINTTDDSKQRRSLDDISRLIQKNPNVKGLSQAQGRFGQELRFSQMYYTTNGTPDYFAANTILILGTWIFHITANIPVAVIEPNLSDRQVSFLAKYAVSRIVQNIQPSPQLLLESGLNAGGEAEYLADKQTEVMTLLSLLKKEEDSTAVSTFIAQMSSAPKRSSGMKKGDYFYSWMDKGLSLFFRDRRVITIHLFSGFDGSSKQYNGQLPAKLKFEHCRKDIHALLGNPQKTDAGGGSPVIEYYDSQAVLNGLNESGVDTKEAAAILTGINLAITYKHKDPSDENNLISTICLCPR